MFLCVLRGKNIFLKFYSSGVLIVPRHFSVRVAAEALLSIWLAQEAEEWVNRIAYLPR